MSPHQLTTEDRVRAQQIEDARRMTDDEAPVRRTLHVVRPAGEKRAAPRNIDKRPLQGHEAFLKALQLSNADVVIEKLSSGHVYYGRVKHSDKFTVTLNVTGIDKCEGHGREVVKAADRVIFKHDISEFFTTTAPRTDRVVEEGAAA